MFPVGRNTTAPTVRVLMVLSPSTDTWAYAPNGKVVIGPYAMLFPVTSVLGESTLCTLSRGGKEFFHIEHPPRIQPLSLGGSEYMGYY